MLGKAAARQTLRRHWLKDTDRTSSYVRFSYYDTVLMVAALTPKSDFVFSRVCDIWYCMVIPPTPTRHNLPKAEASQAHRNLRKQQEIYAPV